MKSLLWIGVLAVLYANPTWAQTAAPKDCRLKRVASLDVVVNPSHEIMVPVTLDGSPFRMRLTLASAASIIFKSVVTARKLPTRPLGTDAVTYGNTRLTETARVDGLALGNARYGRADLLVLAEDGAVPADDIIGNIGMDLLSSLDIELDLAHRKLNLFSQDHCPGDVVYWSATYNTAPMRRGEIGNVYFPMELEGRRIDATLATSTPVTTLTTDVTERLYGFDEHSAGVETEVTRGGSVVRQYRAMELTSSGFSVMNARIQLLPKPASCSVTVGFGKDGEAAYDRGCLGGVPLRIGMNVLEQLHIYIATKEKTLYFTVQNPEPPN
jgi:hypothetical protein